MKRDKINKGIKKSRVIRNEYILYTRLREKKKKTIRLHSKDKRKKEKERQKKTKKRKQNADRVIHNTRMTMRGVGEEEESGMGWGVMSLERNTLITLKSSYATSGVEDEE